MNNAYSVSGHHITLLRNGEEYFPHLITEIDSAAKSVYLETYIYANDESGKRVAASLKMAAQRGVSVHLLIDGFGSAELAEAFVQDLRQAGVKVLWYRRESGYFSFKRYHLRRLHRKLAVIDGRVGFVGGINIVDDLPKGLHAPRLDYAVKVEGVVVRHILASMQRLWLLVSWSQLHRHGLRERIRLLAPKPRQHKVMYLMRDNIRHRRDIEHAYLKAIAEAQHEVIIANAYFLPGRKFRKALLDAVRRGVHVVLFLQGRVEYRLQHYATQALYGELLHAGIEIQEYRASYLHAKVAVIDSEWATVGSSNIDPFSLWLAQEANLVVKDVAFAAALRADLLAEMRQRSHQILPSIWRKLNILNWLVMRISYALARLVASVLVLRKAKDDF